MRMVFFDLETGGLDPARHPITQIAALAVDGDLNEIDSFEAKVRFDICVADPEALRLNRYDPEIWKAEARPPLRVCDDLAAFLKRCADVRLISKRTGAEYWVAQLVGYNAATFDGPFLQSLYRQTKVFLPAGFSVQCVLQRVRWYFIEHDDAHPPEDFKLATVCRHFGVELTDAHDALADVRATLALYRQILAQ